MQPFGTAGRCMKPSPGDAGRAARVTSGGRYGRGSRAVLFTTNPDAWRPRTRPTAGRPGPKQAFFASALAARAVEGSALPLPDVPDGCAGDAARIAFAAVHVIVELEVPRLARRIDVVAQRAAALGDGFGEHVAHRVDEAREARLRKPAGGHGGPDAGTEQRFVGVDVADADDEVIVHERLLDRDAAPARDAPQVIRIECRIERLGAQVPQQWMRARIGHP